MPSMTRLAAMIIFAVIAIQLGLYHGALFDPALDSGSYMLLLALLGAWVGWSYVGKRINGESTAAIGVGLQGMVLGVLFGVGLGAVAQIYTRHMRLPYRDFDHLGGALFKQIADHLSTMWTPLFATSIIFSGILGGLACAALYRLAARRNARG